MMNVYRRTSNGKGAFKLIRWIRDEAADFEEKQAAAPALGTDHTATSNPRHRPMKPDRILYTFAIYACQDAGMHEAVSRLRQAAAEDGVSLQRK